MKLVVGLGNPGAEYRETRHNVGFQVIDELARRWAVEQWREAFESLAARTTRNGEPVLLCKPLTFMNLSGRAVRAILAVLRTGAEVALRSGRTADDYRAALADQLVEIDRLARLADQLLFLCREDAGVGADETESVRLDLLLEDLCESLHLSAEARSATLRCDDLPGCVVEASSDRLRRLFLNLLDNALRHSPPGGLVVIGATTAGRDMSHDSETSAGVIPRACATRRTAATTSASSGVS